MTGWIRFGRFYCHCRYGWKSSTLINSTVQLQQAARASLGDVEERQAATRKFFITSLICLTLCWCALHMLLHIVPLPPLHEMLLSMAHTGRTRGGADLVGWAERGKLAMGRSALKIACAATHHHFPSTSPYQTASATIRSITQASYMWRDFWRTLYHSVHRTHVISFCIRCLCAGRISMFNE